MAVYQAFMRSSRNPLSRRHPAQQTRPADATGCGSPGPGLTSSVPSRKSNGTASYTPSTEPRIFQRLPSTAHIDYVIVRRYEQSAPPGAHRTLADHLLVSSRGAARSPRGRPRAPPERFSRSPPPSRALSMISVDEPGASGRYHSSTGHLPETHTSKILGSVVVDDAIRNVANDIEVERAGRRATGGAAGAANDPVVRPLSARALNSATMGAPPSIGHVGRIQLAVVEHGVRTRIQPVNRVSDHRSTGSLVVDRFLLAERLDVVGRRRGDDRTGSHSDRDRSDANGCR